MSENRFQEYCVRCGKELPHDAFRTLCECGGMIDVRYDLSQVRIRDSGDMIEKYQDLLPIADPDNLVPVGAGDTPTVHAKRLGKHLGLENLFLKDETKNPTGTTKDRPASAVLSYFKELGVPHFTSTATGNSSTAFAVACINNEPFEHSIFVGDRWLHRLTFEDHPRIHVWVLEGAQVTEAIAYSRRWEKENNIPSEGGFFNICRREGLKLAILEAFDQTESHFDWYFQGVSTAMGVYAMYKGALQYKALGRIDRIPKMIGIQEATCQPQVKAWNEGSKEILPHHLYDHPVGICDAILKGNPTNTYPYMYDTMKRTNGGFVAVTKEQVETARMEIYEYEGIPACNASSTTVAALRNMLAEGSIAKQDRVLLNISGSDRDPAIHPRTYHRVIRNGSGEWEYVGSVTEESAA